MAPEVANNIATIQDICKQMQVKSLYLVGSAARVTDYTGKSDLDFLFRFIKRNDGMPAGSFDYFDLLFKLEEVTGKKVDLIAEERINNKYFLQSISEDKVKIYEA